jgi:hypothetical protein
LNQPQWLYDLRTAWSAVSGTDDQEAAPGRDGLTGSGQLHRRHAITDRLSPADIETLIGLYLAGTTIRHLAENNSISQTAVNALQRNRGVRRCGQLPKSGIGWMPSHSSCVPCAAAPHQS